MKYLLDTHILLWWLDGDAPKLGGYLETISANENVLGALGISIISLWEIALLVSKNRYTIGITLNEWFNKVTSHTAINVVALSKDIIIDCITLGEDFPKDPADQLIASTARCHGLKLMTADDRIKKSGCVALA